MAGTSPAMTIHALAPGVASLPSHFYSPPRSERGAARLAHLSGGQGVASSNLAAPTNQSKDLEKTIREHRSKFVTFQKSQTLRAPVQNHNNSVYAIARVQEWQQFVRFKIFRCIPVPLLFAVALSPSRCHRQSEHLTSSQERKARDKELLEIYKMSRDLVSCHDTFPLLSYHMMIRFERP
jgi:hypothetical protein